MNVIKTFAVFLPMYDEEKSDKFRPEHLAFLETMRNEGHVLVNGRFTDGSGGLVIYQASSFQECEKFVKKDPYVREGARLHEIHEWDTVWATK